MVESIYFLKPASCGTHFAGLWPEQGLQPVIRATALRRWFVTRFHPPGGKLPFSSVMSYTGPSDFQDFDVYVHAVAPEVTAVGGVFCMRQLLGTPTAEVFCKTTTPPLPMTRKNFGFSAGAP